MIPVFAIVAGALLTYPIAADAKNGIEKKYEQLQHHINILEKRVALLEKDDTVYGPITVSHIKFDETKHYAVVLPGQTIDCVFQYKLDSSNEKFLSKNHLIVGLKAVAAENCATHLYGVWDSQGEAKFKLTAPLNPGEYEVRIAYRPGETCQEALNSWTILGDEPGSYATIGFLRVTNVYYLHYLKKKY